jgi:cyclic di-GMP phosphodiesterase
MAPLVSPQPVLGPAARGPIGIMLKRISVRDLSLGMYLHQFCGSWMDHPFWRSGFVLKDPNDLARIRETAVREVWIDTSRGLDVASGVPGVSREEADSQIDSQFAEMAEAAEGACERPAAPPSAPSPCNSPTSMEAELRAAALICNRAREAVASMFAQARLGRAVDASGARDLVQEITDSVTRNPCALISLARLKTADDYTYLHSVAVCALMVALARQVQLPEDEVRQAGMAGLLHDLGKAAIPLNILNKPGKLTEEEFAIVREHPVEGHAMLQEVGGATALVLEACLHHHEKMDGSGYPHRQRGDGISLIARMAAICDVYDAITSDRAYKRGWDPADSVRRMAEWGPAHFDPRLFQAFVKSIGIYPVGSLVRLTSGRLGVVMRQSGQALIAPCVNVFFSTKSGLRITPEPVNLAAPGCTERIVAREDPASWGFTDLSALWGGPQG